MTLYYPKWTPGEHAPDGPVDNLTDLRFTANGIPIPWHRDLADAFIFHLVIPTDTDHIEVAFNYVEPSGFGGPYTSEASATNKLVVLNWIQNLLYPAEYPVNRIVCEPSLLVPYRWKIGTALRQAAPDGQMIHFEPVTLDRLVDSPVVAGEFFRAVDITPEDEPVHHELDIVADSEEALNVSTEVTRDLRNLVVESGKLFGTRHYPEYHFLLTLSDHVAHFGLEHGESNDTRLPEASLLGPDAAHRVGIYLAHEFVHSWNGKFRRPEGMTTENFQSREETDLLWFYEGLTNFLGNLLATRSGLWSVDEYHQFIADVAANLGPGRPGRIWRPLLDTAVTQPAMFRGRGWLSWRRRGDYYEEGDLLWLEVAMICHIQGGSDRAFEEFVREFFGGENHGPEVVSFSFSDVVKALNRVVVFDWKTLFESRLTSTTAEAPVEGLEQSGWKVDYVDHFVGSANSMPNTSDFRYSIGLSLDDNGTVSDSIPDGIAFQAGISPGMKVVGVNKHVYSSTALHNAIRTNINATTPITLLLIDDDYFKECALSYHGGERYPRLAQQQGRPNYLDQFLKPLSGR